MPLVIDASAIVPLALADEDATFSNRVLESIAADPPAIVPSLFWLELANVLVVNERRGRIAAHDVDSFQSRVEDTIPIDTWPAPNLDRLIQLARQFSLSVYDAAYLELALRADFPLASHDRRFAMQSSPRAESCFLNSVGWLGLCPRASALLGQSPSHPLLALVPLP